MAGGPGDRWLGHREMAGREESPDTVLRHALLFREERNSRQGNAPGNARGTVAQT
jgi:hypothetical protein